MSKPRIKLLPGRKPAQTAAAEAISSGTASLLSSTSAMVDMLPHDVQGLQLFLRNKIAVARQAARRNHWFGGRMYNRFSGEDPDYVQLSGMHLGQVLPLVGIDSPEIVDRSGHYLLRLDLAQQALDNLVEENVVPNPAN